MSAPKARGTLSKPRMLKAFGEALYRAMDAQPITTVELARILKFETAQPITQILNGVRAPSLSRYRALMQLFPQLAIYPLPDLYDRPGYALSGFTLPKNWAKAANVKNTEKNGTKSSRHLAEVIDVDHAPATPVQPQARLALPPPSNASVTPMLFKVMRLHHVLSASSAHGEFLTTLAHLHSAGVDLGEVLRELSQTEG
jgi:hypothetical protein